MSILHGQWESYSGNYTGTEDFVIGIRPLDTYLNNVFEYVVIRKTEDGMAAWFHGLVDTRDYLDNPYGLDMLNQIFKSHDYDSFDSFVLEILNGDRTGLEYKPDGTIDIINSASYIVDLPLMSAHIAAYAAQHICSKHPIEISMPIEDAVEQFKLRTGLNNASEYLTEE